MKSIKKLLLVSLTLSTVMCVDNVASAYCSHDWTDWKIELEPTCSSKGYEERECLECYDWETRDIPATGVHDWVEWEADGYLCEDGKYTRYCRDCWEEETKARKGDGSHLWSDWEVWEKADCLNNGKEYRKCLNCYEYEYKEIPSDSNMHDWCNWYAVEDATAIENGIMKRYCYTCDVVEEKETEKLKPVLELSTKQKSIKRGKSFFLRVSKYTYGDYIVKVLSSNKKVATINKKGKVVGKNKGTAKITVKMKSGIKKTCKVIVK